MDPDCTGTVVERNYDVIIEVRLFDSGVDTGITNTNAKFNVEIGDVCETDILTFDSVIPNWTYKLRIPARPEFDAPVINNFNVCPVTCTLSEYNGSSFIPVSAGFGIRFNNPPTVLVQTSDKSLDQQFIDLRITCTSVFSLQPAADKTKVNDFRITYLDECRDSQLYRPAGIDATIPLYKESFVPVNVASSQYNCPVTTYEIVSVTATNPVNAVVPANFARVSPSLSAVFQPNNLANLGQFTVIFRAKWIIGADNTERIADSLPFVVTIVDPCLTTRINSAGWLQEMSAPQLGND